MLYDSTVYIRSNCLFYAPKELWEAYSYRTVRPSRFVSGAYLLYSLRQEFQICVDASWDGGVSRTIFGSLTSDLVFIVITMSVRPSRFVSGAYLLYSLR